MFLPNFPVLWKSLENGTLVWICNRSEVEVFNDMQFTLVHFQTHY